MKDVMESPEGLAVVKAIIDEAIAVAEAEGILFGKDFRQSCITYLKGGGDHRPSMAVDLENGLPTEIDHLNGRIIEYGLKHNLPTQVNQTVTALVQMAQRSMIQSRSDSGDARRINTENRFQGIELGSLCTELNGNGE
jgi:2-dehydropantoate 2-reductase